MADSDDLLRKLVLKLHLNVEERKQFGRNQIYASEILKIILEEFKNAKFYPSNAHPWKEGEAVREGYFIEKLSFGKYCLHWQRHQAVNPYVLAEKNQSDYQDENRVVQAFIKMEYRDNIDGIRINYDFK